jgi:hypothetical protein
LNFSDPDPSKRPEVESGNQQVDGGVIDTDNAEGFVPVIRLECFGATPTEFCIARGWKLTTVMVFIYFDTLFFFSFFLLEFVYIIN